MADDETAEVHREAAEEAADEFPDDADRLARYAGTESVEEHHADEHWADVPDIDQRRILQNEQKRELAREGEDTVEAELLDEDAVPDALANADDVSGLESGTGVGDDIGLPVTSEPEPEPAPKSKRGRSSKSSDDDIPDPTA